MSGKWPGGFIKKTAPTVVGPVDGEGGSASGVWTLDQVADYEQRGLWPKPTITFERRLYSWGFNNQGQLGQGNTTNRSSPVQVGSLTNWLTIAGGYFHTLAVKFDGTLWTWGKNADGQLGLGDTTTRSSPVQVGALTTWLDVAGGYSHSIAIKTDGTLWVWGENNYGQLGTGSGSGNTSSPVQVGALTNWAKVAENLERQSFAITTDGKLYGWGRNNSGILGVGDTTNRSSPVQVGSNSGLFPWQSASGSDQNSTGVSTDGKLWTMGKNDFGQLGKTGATVSSPTQVGALTNWSFSVSGNGYSMSATKTDGTLWSWGNNGSGELGNSSNTNTNSPVQVGALTTWSRVGAGSTWRLAIKTDGTIWAWGANLYGPLGQGNTTNYNSPVQIGSETTWTKVAASGGRTGFGVLKTDPTPPLTYQVTVANTGSGNKYYINGVQQATVSLPEGGTYRFDQSAGSNSGHPFRFSITSDGTHAGGSEYTTGVTTSGTPGNAGAYTQIVVASGAPTLYYYCSVHSGMGGQANTP